MLFKKLDYKWQVLSVVIFGSFMVVLDSTVVNVTIPTFEKVFHADVNGVQWILTGYLLALGIITPLAGYLADNFGIKKMYILALTFFIIGSVLCGFSQNLWMLVVFRILQGLGGGATVPLGTAQLFAAFPPQQRGLANGVFGVPLLVAPALGPTLGGFLIQYFHWSLIFYINVPIGLAGIAMATWLLKPSQTDKNKKHKLDWWGVILASSGLGLLLLALSEASALGWGNWLIIALFAVSIILLVVFAIAELRSKDPIVDLRLYRKPVYNFGSIANWVAVIALFATAFLLPLYLQNVRNNNPFEVGLLLLPQALTAAVIVPFSGRLYDKIGGKVLVTIGLTILAVTSWFFTTISTSTDILFIEILLGLRGVALALCLQPTLNISLDVVDKPALPRASSLFNAMRQVMQALATAILSTILATQTASSAGALAAQHKLSQQQIQTQASVSGLTAAFTIAFWVAAIGVISGLLLPGWPGKWPIGKQAAQAQEQKDEQNKKPEQPAKVEDKQAAFNREQNKKPPRNIEKAS